METEVDAKVDRMVANPATGKLLGRIERWPLSSYHMKVRAIVGTANFFDAIDYVTIGLVLPVFGQLWHLTPGQMGLLISGSFLGQMVGATGFGRLAERYGRIPILVLVTAIYGLANISCALAVGFSSLLLLRIVQGLGIGALSPVAATYINEIAPTKGRGRFVLLFELLFAIGILAAGFLGRWIIPNYGWKAMFLVGGIPPVLILPAMYRLPESARWLISRERFEEADKVISHIEEKISATGKTLPPRSSSPFPPLPFLRAAGGSCSAPHTGSAPWSYGPYGLPSASSAGPWSSGCRRSTATCFM